MEDVGARLRFLSANGADISTEFKFVASHFHDFSCHCEALNALPFALIYEIIGHGALKLESEDSLYNFIREGTETNQEMFELAANEGRYLSNGRARCTYLSFEINWHC
jgi:hypothetical protein